MLKIGEPCTLEENQCYFRQIGPLKLWLEYSGQEWLLATEHTLKEKNISTVQKLPQRPTHSTWIRYVVPYKNPTLTLVPVTPERSVVVKPESPLRIASGAEALFFVLFPLWVKLVIGQDSSFSLAEIPSQVLSNTWFGQPHEGELCYCLKTWARRSLDGIQSLPHWIVCPVHIRNTASSDLDFTRLCIRTGFLSIYRGVSWLWTNRVFVQFRGVNQSSRIRYDHTAPTFEASCQLIGKPRQKPAKEFTIKTFDTFNLFVGG